MVKKKRTPAPKAQDGVAATPADVKVQADGEISGPIDGPAPQNTFTAASGKFFALARSDYPEPEDFTEDFTCDVVGAAEGDLLEVLAIHKGWAYGRRFKPRQGLTLEGVFRLDWVCGVKLILEAGSRKTVEVDICSDEYGFKGPAANDTGGKLQVKRYKKRIEDAANLWDKLEAQAAATDVIADQEATAAKVAEQLEKDDAEARDRRKKEEERREAILAEVKRRKAEAEYAKKQTAVEAERARMAEEEAKRLAEAEQAAQRRAKREAEEARHRAILEEAAAEAERARLAEEEAKRLAEAEEAAQRRAKQEAEEARCRAILEEQARQEAEEAETRRLEQEACAEDVGTPIDRSIQGMEVMLDTPSTGHDHQSSSEASCGGGDDSRDCSTPKCRTGLQKKTIPRKFRWPASELDDVTGEWEKVQEEMANKSSDLDTLEEKVNSLLHSQGSGYPPEIGPPPGLELMSEAERNAAEVNVLKQRVFQGLLKMKRSAGFERKTSVLMKKKVFQAMFSAKRSSSETRGKESEMKSLQLKNLMKRAFKGMRDSTRSTDGESTPRGLKCEGSPSSPLSTEESPQGDLQMIAEQVVEQLQTKAESIKAQIRKGLLRAHRAGELIELRHELDELADSVSQMGAKLGSGSSAGLEPLPNSSAEQATTQSLPGPCRISRRKRWSEYTSTDSESEPAVMGRHASQAISDFSDSDVENKRGRRWAPRYQ